MQSPAHFPEGLITANLTPVDAQQRPNHSLLANHCANLLERGCSGIALLGTTGEANSFSLSERKEILEQLIASGFEVPRIMLGTGMCSLNDSVDLIKHGLSNGVRDFLIMPPYYYRGASEQGIFDYFAHLIRSVDDDRLRIYYYHFPKMSGCDLSIDMIKRLFDTFPETMVGMKDSGGDFDHMRHVVEAVPTIRLYAGTERLMTQAMDIGAVGCISATTNYDPALAAQVYRLHRAHDESHIVHEKMLATRAAFEGNILAAALKGVISRQTGNLEWSNLKLPLTPLPESLINDIIEALESIPD